jgi:homoserine kinase
MSNRKKVVIRVPATSANLGSGFDSIGVALNWSATYTVEITENSNSSGYDPIQKMVAKAAATFFKQEKIDDSIEFAVTYESDIPVGRGLGVSASARAAGIIAANALANTEKKLVEMLPLAVDLEGHADNIVPAILGGIRVVVIDGSQINQIEIPIPDDLSLVILTPKFSMPTEKSRKSLPSQLSRQEVVHNTGRIAILIAAITQGNYDLLHIGVQDILHQPSRSKLFPAMYDLFDVATSAGAYAAYLSGGGSSIAAFVNELKSAEVAEAMTMASDKYDLGAKVTICSMSDTGAELLSIE